jgi:hypothetical protein
VHANSKYTQESTAVAEYIGEYIVDDAQPVKVTIENDVSIIRHSSHDAADKPTQISEGAFISKYRELKYEFLKPMVISRYMCCYFLS